MMIQFELEFVVVVVAVAVVEVELKYRIFYATDLSIWYVRLLHVFVVFKNLGK